MKNNTTEKIEANTVFEQDADMITHYNDDPSCEPEASDELRTSSQQEQIAAKLVERASQLGSYLRHAGSLMLVFSALAFLLQKWGAIDHITRYFSFLGFTGVMAGAALLCGLGVKEGKGARTLFALVVALTPVHFAQLGGLLFSVFGEVPSGVSYPSYFYWQADSVAAVVGTLGVAMLCLYPLLFLALSTLDRALAKYLTVGVLFANATLLIPTRAPDFIATIAIASLVGVVAFLHQLRGQVKFNTFESRFARATLYLPAVLLLGRQVALYGVSEALVSSCLFVVAATMFVVIPRFVGEHLAAFSQWVSAFPLIIGWGIIVNTFGVRDDATLLLSFGLPPSIALITMSLFSKYAHQSLQYVASFISLGTVLLALDADPSVVTSAASLMTVLGLTTLAFVFENRFMLLLGGLGGVVTSYYHIRMLTGVIDFNLWVTLGVCGVGAIIAASLLEKHLSSAVQYVTSLRKVIAKW